MTIKAKAYVKLGASQSTEHRRNWTFPHYVQAHQGAHAEVALVGEAVPETKKAQDFLANIMDPTLQMGVTHCFGEPEKLKSFESCQQYLLTLATTTRAYVAAGRAVRSVSSASTGTGSKLSGGKGTKRKGGKKQTTPTPKVTPTRSGGLCLIPSGLRSLRHARKPAAKARRKPRGNAKLLSLELIPGTETGTVIPRL
jgi:hypothetical protein